MGNIIQFEADRHDELRKQLPWYATGQLSPEDRARVEAHLAVCEECRHEVHFENRLEEEIRKMPIDVDQSWARMRDKIAEDASLRPLHRAGRKLHQLPAWTSWAAAAVAIGIVTTGVTLHQSKPVADPAYQVLSDKSAKASAGNAVVIFRPDMKESVLRQALLDADARLVDGPTATGGYILRITPTKRDAALAKLRARKDVEMAQPIDNGGTH